MKRSLIPCRKRVISAAFTIEAPKPNPNRIVHKMTMKQRINYAINAYRKSEKQKQAELRAMKMEKEAEKKAMRLKKAKKKDAKKQKMKKK
eukprot:TRINITY_DN559_c0_g1_i2.p2 TRINITY_DN559_c0_g1~~TRINITY_DN559_c0_g1_i2.p2  ORF type:complete len:105 (+),score=16.40 TRINITY_DN559_c0_g1_i2:46-315(+)